MTERLNLLSYRRNLRRRSTSKSDYTRWLGPSWAPISDRAAATVRRLRSLGRGNGDLAGRHRLKFGVRARLKDGPGAVSHDQQTAGQHDYVLQHEPPAA